MYDLEVYMHDLIRVLHMNFDKLFLVHTMTLSPEHIIFDANKKIRDYINYREERESLIIELIKVN
jgi:hypothetical protein